MCILYVYLCNCIYTIFFLCLFFSLGTCVCFSRWSRLSISVCKYMCVFVNMNMYVFMYVHINKYACGCTYAFIWECTLYMRMCVCMYIWMCVGICMFICVYGRIWVCESMWSYIWLYESMRVRVYICVYVYLYSRVVFVCLYVRLCTTMSAYECRSLWVYEYTGLYVSVHVCM